MQKLRNNGIVAIGRRRDETGILAPSSETPPLKAARDISPLIWLLARRYLEAD